MFKDLEEIFISMKSIEIKGESVPFSFMKQNKSGTLYNIIPESILFFSLSFQCVYLSGLPPKLHTSRRAGKSPWLCQDTGSEAVSS